MAITEPTRLRSQEDEEYYALLQQLSQASVDQHFEAFKDIPWDDPEYAYDATDPRFILPEADELGAHPWYKALPRDEQIRVGAYRFAQVAKVGRQFEQILIGGLMHHLIPMENNNPEFRYAMHEATEECHHIQMFQEAVNRSGQNAVGVARFWTKVAPIVTGFGLWFPELFFIGILGGEEPIDHLQKSIMRGGGTHPLIDRVMQIHIAEEARHIGFAHHYLEHHWKDLGFFKKHFLRWVFPVVMRVLCDIIMIPSKPDRAAMGIPDNVTREIWWNSKDSRRRLQELFGDVRMLADRLKIRRGPVRLLWKALKIDGPASRFRSEPKTTAA